jgi:hypothetical protein
VLVINLTAKIVKKVIRSKSLEKKMLLADYFGDISDDED